MLLIPSVPYDWTTNPTILAWISVASLIVGVLGILFGIGIGYWFYRKGKNWHQIIYQVISDTPIVSVREQLGRGKIKVTYETTGGHVEEINDARLFTFRIWNAGNGDVIIWSSQDKAEAKLEVPIEFEFEGRTVVGLTHLETNPSSKVIHQKDLDDYLNSFPSTTASLGLPRCILKQNQAISLGILLNGPSGNFKMKEGKLLNGEIISYYELSRAPVTWKFISVLLLTIITTALISYIFYLYKISLPQIDIQFWIILILIFFIFGLVSGFKIGRPYPYIRNT